MSRFLALFIGGLFGGIAGFVAGVLGWMLFYYVVFMLPEGTSWRAMDQGAIPIVFTGPAGAVVGTVLGVRILSRWIKTKQGDPSAGSER